MYILLTVASRSDIYTLSLHDALPIYARHRPARAREQDRHGLQRPPRRRDRGLPSALRSEEHTSELQSRGHLVCRPLLGKKNRETTRSSFAPADTRRLGPSDPHSSGAA